MWRPDRRISGPEPLTVADIPALNRLFAEAFTDRYRKDGLTGVRVPHLNRIVWRYAIEGAGAGAFAWCDARGDLAAFNLVHRSGREGWMGPLAVRPDVQGDGLGRTIVTTGIRWLQREGATTIGLETMPRTLDNIGFYSRLGFRPGPLTITLQHDAMPGLLPRGARLGSLDGPARAAAVAACRALTTAVVPGIDFSRELALTHELALGDVSLLHAGDGALIAFALWHVAPLAEGRAAEDLRVLKLVARDDEAARQVLRLAEAEVAPHRLRSVSVRCQTRHDTLFAALIADGWRVQWTDLRVTLAGHAEVPPRGVLLSNWEI
jgi:GNAT superfamily N-acetyltransferase